MSYEKVGDFPLSDCSLLMDVFYTLPFKESEGPEVHYRTSQNAKDAIKGIKALHHIWPFEDWHNAMFISIPANGRIPLHTESLGIGQEDKGPWFKYHIPLYTNEHAISYSDGIEYNLDIGNIYKLDFKKPHESVNKGQSDRVHLVMEIYE